MRNKFEKLPSISWAVKCLQFDQGLNEYKVKDGMTCSDYTLGFVNGAWFVYRKGWNDDE